MQRSMHATKRGGDCAARHACNKEGSGDCAAQHAVEGEGKKSIVL